jgi:uncharacterized protein
MFGLTIAATAACLLAVYVGATVQASVGIGVGMIASPVLALVDPAFIPAAILISILPLSVSVAWADRPHIDRRGVVVALIGRVPGVIIGAWVAASLSDTVIALLVAGSVLFAVVVSVTTKRFRTTTPSLMLAGMASGFTGTTTGVGGPPMALTYQRQDPAMIRSTLSAFFTVGSLISLLALAVAGDLGRRQWQLGLMLLPAIGLGVVTARRYQDRLRPSIVRPALLVICTGAALALLLETLL